MMYQHSNRKRTRRQAVLTTVAVLTAAASLRADPVFRTQNFDTDPNWTGHNNRATTPAPQVVTQNFGYTTSNFAGDPNDTTGEIGGRIMPAGEAAYYAKAIAPLSFDDSLSASGNLYVQTAGHHTLLGFFNAGTIENGWRNPNEFALRLQEDGNGAFEAFVDYSTGLWRAGGVPFADQNGNNIVFPTNQQYQWSIHYDPSANSGAGGFQGTLSNSTIGTVQTALTPLAPGRKLDRTTLNRFGMFNTVTQYDDRAGNVWADDLSINNGIPETFAQNPNWDARRNNTSYTTDIVRPRFNFGYSPTHNAGGANSGEMGGNIWAGDSRTEFNGTHMAYYGDTLAQTLTLDNPLHASGKVSFERGSSDSMAHIGFFHSTDSVRSSDSQTMHQPEDFLGVTIEGPSDEGFFFYPSYGLDPEGMGSVGTRGSNPPRIYPDGTSHDWTLDYNPNANGGLGQIIVTLDGNTGVLNLAAGHKQIGAHFDRFGMITPQIDGNGQAIYFDDLTYTVSADGPDWARDASGNWLDPANWVGAVPNGIGANATFGNVITADRFVYANSPVTVGTLNFTDNNRYRLGGFGTLTLQVADGSAQVNVTQGSHSINLPLILASDTTFNVAAASHLVVSDPMTINAGKTLTQTGSGDVTYQSTVTLQAGARIQFGGIAAAVTAMSMDAGSRAVLLGASKQSLAVHDLSMEATATFDVGRGELLVGGADYTTIAAKVKQGMHGGDWRGSGITSAAAAADPAAATALGVADSDAGTLVKYTFYGDADLDGDVTLADFDHFESNFGRSDAQATWSSGDFDYDGSVNADDFKLFVLGLGSEGHGGVSGEFFAAISRFNDQQGLNVDLSAVPEPSAALAIAGAVTAGAVRRRRRKTAFTPSAGSPRARSTRTSRRAPAR